MQIQSGKSIPILNKRSSMTDPYQKVAKGMETQFLNYLLSQMRKTIEKVEKDSSEMSYYQTLLDYEYAKVMSDQNEGNGIQKLILDNIRPKSPAVHHTQHQIKKYQQMNHRINNE